MALTALEVLRQINPNYQIPAPTPAMLGDRGDNRTNVLNSNQTRIIGSTSPSSNIVQGTGGGNIGYVDVNGQYVPYGYGLIYKASDSPTPAPTGLDDLQKIQQDALTRARDEARRQAGAGFERARGIYDEGMGLLTKRRGEFKDLFEQGRGNILDRYEQGRGELQASDQGAQTRLANAMRAMGMGGSAYIKSIGKQTQDAAKALGGLQTERNKNEKANLGEFNTRQNWADTQEGALQRSLSDAEEARNKVESSADLGYLSDVGNLFNTILSNQLATKAAAGQYTANPYAVNISSMTNKLNGGLPTTGQTGAEGVQNVSINENDPLKKRLLARSGGSLYGIA